MAISAEFTADFTQYNAAVTEATGGLEGLVDAGGKLDEETAKAAEAAGKEIAKFGRAVIAVADDFLSSYAEEEAAAARLVAALEAQGTASDTVIQAYQDMGAEFQKTTKYSDDAIASAQAVFTTIGRVGPDNMEPAITAATNLASALNVDLSTAVNMIAKAVGSGGESLGRLSTVLGDVDVKGKPAAEILALINERVGGAAAADMSTYEGQTARLANQFDDMKGKIGGLIADALTPVLDLFFKLPEPVQAIISAAAVLGTTLGPLVAAFASVMGAVAPLIPLLVGPAGISGAIATVAALLGPASLIIAAIVGIVIAFKKWDQIVEIAKGVYEGIKRWMVDGMTEIAGWVKSAVELVAKPYTWLADKLVGHSVIPDMMNGIEREFGRLKTIMVDPTADAVAQVLSSFNVMSHNVSLIATDPGGVPHDLFGRPVVASGTFANMGRTFGRQPGSHFGAVNITVNGHVLSTEEQLAMVMENAMMEAYRKGGARIPI